MLFQHYTAAGRDDLPWVWSPGDQSSISDSVLE